MEVEELMSRDEMINYEINYYVNLLRIKDAETGVNKELDYQINVQENKLHTLGVNTDNFKILN
ncbi:MAG: hypothetical protein E7266_06340 [Lachnospiraceae bacterium]|nr:hypothetical protein [Lachnospiraceae bacterium]